MCLACVLNVKLHVVVSLCVVPLIYLMPEQGPSMLPLDDLQHELLANCNRA